VLNDYWKKISLQHQEQKDAALKKIVDLNFTEKGYPLLRYHIAAAICAGANLVKGKYISPVGDAIIMKDYFLCKLFLESGARPKNFQTKKTTFFKIKTKALAELFLQHGAQIGTDFLGRSVISNAM
jgi:ubiquitin C-terminal hydrolase